MTDNKRVIVRIFNQPRTVEVVEVRPRADGEGEDLLVFDEAARLLLLVTPGNYEYIGVHACNWLDYMRRQAELGDTTQAFQTPQKIKLEKENFRRIPSAEEKRRSAALKEDNPIFNSLSKEELQDLLETLQELQDAQD